MVPIFLRFQREKLAVQAAVAERMDQMQEERQQLTDLIATSVELERQLDSAQKQLTGKRADLKALEAQKSELARTLTIAEVIFHCRSEVFKSWYGPKLGSRWL